MKYNSKKIHEKYHSKTSSQFKKITKSNFTYRILIKKLEKYLSKKIEVLDIGCGAGTLDFYIADKVKKIKGIDISKKAINSCLVTKNNLTVKNVEFEVVRFPQENMNEKYNLIIFTEIIEHIEDDRIALKKIRNVLKPHGILFLSTVSNNAPLFKLGLADKFDTRVGHLRRYDLNELISLIQGCGFTIREVNKSEGIIRNFLFINEPAGKLIKFIKFFVSDFVTFVDNITIPLFGESNYIIVAEKT